MPNRIVRDWTDSERVNTLDAPAERFFVRLMMKADDFGRFHAEPRLLRSFLFPYLLDSVRDADISRWIAACVKAGLIVVYESQGKRLLEIVNFGQRLRSAVSKFPAPPTIVSDSPSFDGGLLTNDRGPPLEAETESETRIEAEAQKSCTEPSEADARVPEPESPPIMVFPCVGKGPTEWPLSREKLAEYGESYPGVDVLTEARKALQWARDNPSRRKTFKGMSKFLNAWMQRANDEPRRSATAGRSASTGASAVERERQRMQDQLDAIGRFVAGEDDSGGVRTGHAAPRRLEANGEFG